MKHRKKSRGLLSTGVIAAFVFCFVTAGVQGQRQIRPQRKPEFPKIDSAAASLVIVLRHTGVGWDEAYGFNTLVYRFFGEPDTGYAGATLHELHSGGERLSVRYRFEHKAGGTIIHASRAVEGGLGTELPESTIKQEAGRFRVSGRQARIVRMDEHGRVAFAAPDESYEENYPFDSPSSFEDMYKESRTIRKTRDGQIVAVGKFLPPWPERSDENRRLRYLERKPWDPMGAETIEAGFWEESDAALFCVDGVEPLAEGYIRGFPVFSDSPAWLGNLALVDAVAGQGGILRLAYVAANTFQSVSSSGGVAVNSSRTPVLGCGMDNFHEWSIILPEAELRRAPYLRSPFIGHPIAAN